MVSAKAIASVSDLVMGQATTLEKRLAAILSTHANNELIHKEFKIDNVHAYNGMSGHNYWASDVLVGQLYMGTLLSGTYVIYKRTYINEEICEQYDYYDQKGNFFYTSQTLDGQCLVYSSISMDPTNPFINHIYNVLHNEYEGTTINYGNTGRIKFLEDILEGFYRTPEYNISVNQGLKDQAIKNIAQEIISIENDKVLNWTERQNIFKQLKQVRSKILNTKRRVHGFQYMLYDFLIMTTDLKLKFNTFRQRPINNFIGALYRHTLGNLFWFVGTVKSNLGYSVALAIYGPFTFYFITQPMNPHAMWAVGKVRKGYIQVSQLVDPPKEISHIAQTEDDEGTNDNTQDKVSTSQAATKVVTASKVIPWNDRMSNFKAMQISYEESMVFSERMGRIEQFESQFNFSLTAEAAWMEMELYLKQLKGDLEYYKELDPKYSAFLKNETKRTLELQFYIWQKLGQFFLDHPYIVVDEEKEQTQRNYYLGRQFIFFQTMTKKLTELGIADSPVTHKNIKMLAEQFSDMKIEGNSVLDTLKKNSKIFQQKNFLSTDEHRSYMKRQWEVLFMQQNKKQEASSFSLQAYTWSIRNAIWLLQTIYSAKRSEIASMSFKFDQATLGTHNKQANPVMNEYLENMFNNLTVEFVSIKKEMVDSLPGDNEAQLRENVINNIKVYLIERDKLFNAGIYASNASVSTNI
ncbi:MAG: hypothetical protein HON90_16705 [Halobacteriovoraceae bacterium]|nr:hypothetical protein [Halobacteriovoraceae bacterium]